MSYSTDYHQEKYDPTGKPQFEVLSSLTGDDVFVPRYYPKRVTMDKERDLVREKGICLGEYVNDLGAKNREFDLSGKLITPELGDYHNLLDNGTEYQIITMTWQGEVLLMDSSLEGPVGVDVETKHYLYEYRLEFVSTGADEAHQGESGIIQ